MFLIDTHVDIAWPNKWTDDVRERMQADVDRLAEGGVNGVIYVAYVPQRECTPENRAAAIARTTQMIARIRRFPSRKTSKPAQIVYSSAELERTVSDGKIAISVGIENGFGIGRDLALVPTFHALGARYITLLHNGHNDIGDSAMPMKEIGDAESKHGGLSEFGMRVIDAMNHVGMIVDVSHCAKSTMMQATERSRAPVFASHSCARGLVDHPRNLDDEQLDAIRDCGGTIHITAIDSFLNEGNSARSQAVSGLYTRFPRKPGDVPYYDFSPEVWKEFSREYEEINRQFPMPNVERLVDHVEYVAKRIGVDCVGFASDFEGGGELADWRTAADTQNIVRALKTRGFDQDEIERICGKNFLRVLRNAEEVAAQ